MQRMLMVTVTLVENAFGEHMYAPDMAAKQPVWTGLSSRSAGLIIRHLDAASTDDHAAIFSILSGLQIAVLRYTAAAKAASWVNLVDAMIAFSCSRCDFATLLPEKGMKMYGVASYRLRGPGVKG
jgi:hypothetical protein